MEKYKQLKNIKPLPGIYKITSPIGKVYIGRSINIVKRLREHNNNIQYRTHIGRSILKYGYANHRFDVLSYTAKDNDLLNKLEIFYIDLYNSTNPEVGLNLSAGGGRLNFHHKQETIEKMRRNRAGRRNSLGRVLSDETKRKISMSLTGNTMSTESLNKANMTRIERGDSKLFLDLFTGVFYYSERDLAKFSEYKSRTDLRKNILKSERYVLC